MPVKKSQPNARTAMEDPVAFRTRKQWAAWLAKHHARSSGVWIRFAKKAARIPSVTYQEALDVALCYGWIDGIRKAHDDSTFLQRFSPRQPRSIWSKINREKAIALIASGEMKPAGLAQVERARANGRWDSAYSLKDLKVTPPDFQAALDDNPKAKAFFETLDSRNRYAFVFRIHNLRRPETRARKIAEFMAMLNRKECHYP